MITSVKFGRVLLSVLILTLVTEHVYAQGIRALPLSTLQTLLAGDLLTPAAGSAQGDVTVVEYFDYDCPVCRHLEPELRKLLASDPKIRVVRKDWPVFGDACEGIQRRVGAQSTRGRDAGSSRHPGFDRWDPARAGWHRLRRLGAVSGTSTRESLTAAQWPGFSLSRAVASSPRGSEAPPVSPR